MTKPSKEEYDQAKKNVKFFKDTITSSRKKIMELVDKISLENQTLKNYEKDLEENQKVVNLYDLYKEAELQT